MEVLEDLLVKRVSAALLLTTVAISGIAGCSGPDASPEPTVSKSAPHPATPKPTATAVDKALSDRAHAAVSTLDTNDPAFVESGDDTVAQGVHNQSPLPAGKTYQVLIACAGTGSVEVVVADFKPHVQACDANPSSYRVTSKSKVLDFSIKGRPGASGAIAWQISNIKT
ncbi:hypothetical protein [Streptomyces sp. NPDC093225]|uniref:hypothetical protein n=1 Tax=Streptomyces sp. NPDC093225 TaxID=3366034 RepID=UPI00380E6EE7